MSMETLEAMNEYTKTHQLAYGGACAILSAFEMYQAKFRGITRRAKLRFENCEWQHMQADAVERLELYRLVMTDIVNSVTDLLGTESKDHSVWCTIKREYGRLIGDRNDIEIAQTFFNSVTRLIFTTVGVDPDIEFLNVDEAADWGASGSGIYRTYANAAVADCVRQALLSCQFHVPYEDMERDTALVAHSIEAHLQTLALDRSQVAIEIVKPVFYRNKGAYLVGRIRAEAQTIPIVLPLMHSEEGIFVDTVLLSEADVSRVFSFARSYFHVEVEYPRDLVGFLRSLVPMKPIAEIYTAIGFNKHGKTELYKDLLRHLRDSHDKFEVAQGEKGMVMTVFTMPSFDVVFKVIKDSFDYPKTTTRKDVLEKYRLVFKHDRGGRLIDAQEFEHVKFDRNRFAPELLEELLRVAASSVAVEGQDVIIKHMYTERRVTPLNLYLRTGDDAAARAAVLDYGQAIKDLAATNIFPGDILLKNFGVTRRGKVIFYDYDELCFVTDCHFRDMPVSRDEDEELAGEPWFFVDKYDMFPSEFQTFLGLRSPLKELFTAVHGDLFRVDFWRQMQARHNAGEVLDLFPYEESKRLKHRAALQLPVGTAAVAVPQP